MQHQTTALTQLGHRFGSINESASIAGDSEQLTHTQSLPIEHQEASSDEDEQRKEDPAVRILPPIDGQNSAANRRITFIQNVEENSIADKCIE